MQQKLTKNKSYNKTRGLNDDDSTRGDGESEV